MARNLSPPLRRIYCAARVAELCEHRRQLLAAVASDAAAETHGLRRWEAGGYAEGSLYAFNARDVELTGRKEQLNSADGDCPAMIGPYRLVRLLKVGGQAAVYLAKHPLDGRDVVIKWAHATWLTCPELAERFTDESRLWAELKDRRLVQVYDLGIADHA